MTKEQKIEAFSMLMDGKTYSEVGEHFGVTKQRIHQLFPMQRNNKPVCKKEKPLRYIYPNIEKWMRENKVSLAELSLKIGCSSNTICRNLLGYNEPGKRLIDEIIKLTGMTYEEAFKK